MMDGVIELPSQTDLPPGKTFKCMECGTRIREGQPHTALAPRPHQTLSLLIVNAYADDEGLGAYVAGSHAGITGFRPPLRETTSYRHRRGHELGRILARPLTKGPDGVWREARD